jgi:hypothetical protein
LEAVAEKLARSFGGRNVAEIWNAYSALTIKLIMITTMSLVLSLPWLHNAAHYQARQ